MPVNSDMDLRIGHKSSIEVDPIVQEQSEEVLDITPVVDKIRGIDEVVELPELLAKLSMQLVQLYREVSDSDLKRAIRVLYEYMSYPEVNVGGADSYLKALLDDPSSQKLIEVFEEILAKEQKLRNKLLPTWKGSLQKVIEALDDLGVDNFIDSGFENIVLAELSKFRDPDRKGAIKGFTHSDPEDHIDLQNRSLVINAKILANDSQFERAGFEAFTTIMHESIHNLKSLTEDTEQERTSEQTDCLEILTDCSTVYLSYLADLSRSEELGANKMEFDYYYKYGSQFEGYQRLRRLAHVLDILKLVDRQEMLNFGLQQDYKGFMSLLDERFIQLKGDSKENVLNHLAYNFLIGKEEYEQLIRQDFNFTDIITTSSKYNQKLKGVNENIGMMSIGMSHMLGIERTKMLPDPGKALITTEEALEKLNLLEEYFSKF